MLLWAWHRFLDFAGRWLQPLAAFITLVSGTFLTFDYTAWRQEAPRWPGLIDLLENNMAWLFFGSAGLSLLIGFGQALRERTVGELQREIANHRGEIDAIGNSIVILFDGLLLNLGTKLAVQQQSQVRMSLYVHDPKGKRFIPCGRHSPNPVYAGPGRTSYPDNEGCIAEGWKKGWHFDNQVPDGVKERKAHHRKTYGISDATQASLKMPSTLYGVRRLDDGMGRSVGLIVVEATMSTEFEEAALHARLDEVADDFARTVHTLRNYIPDPADAAAKGL